MGFDTHLEITLVDSETPNLEAVKEKILALLNRDGIHHDVYFGLVDAFAKARGHFRVHSGYLVDLIEGVAQIVPDVSFDVRCLGEEFRHTWIAEYRAGLRVYIQGPWGYE